MDSDPESATQPGAATANAGDAHRQAADRPDDGGNGSAPGLIIAVPPGAMALRIAGVPPPIRLLRQLRLNASEVPAILLCADPSAAAAWTNGHAVTTTPDALPDLLTARRAWLCVRGDLVFSGDAGEADADGAVELGRTLEAEAGADIAAWARHVLGGEDGAPDYGRPLRLPPRAVATRVRDAEHAAQIDLALQRTLARPQDPNFPRLTGRRFSSPISLRLARAGVSANAVTFAGIGVGLLAAALFAVGGYWWTLAGAVMLMFSRLLDDCDGEVARLTFTESSFGARLDVTSDILVHTTAFLALAWSGHRADPSAAHDVAFALLLFGGAVSTFLILRFVTGTDLPEKSRLIRMIETSASGDFAYLLFAIALLGQAHWFLWVAAVGAQAFWMTLAFLIWRARSPRPGHTVRPAAGWSRWVEVGLFVVGTGLLLGLIRQTGWAQLTADLALVGWGFAWLCLVEVIPIIACTAGWMVTIAPEARRISFMRLLAARLAGDSINHLTPTATLGGEFVRARLVSNQLGVQDSTSSVTLAKFAETAGQVVFIVLGLLLILPALQPLGAVRWGLLVVVAACAVGIALLARMLDRGFFAFAARQLSRAGLGAAWFDRHAAEIDAIDTLVRDAMRRRPRDVLASVGWYAFAFAASVIEVWLAMRFLGVAVTWQAALGIEVLSVLVDAVFFFMPAKLGTQEGGKMLAFTLFGLPPEKGLAMGLIRRGRELFWDVIGLAAFAALRTPLTASAAVSEQQSMALVPQVPSPGTAGQDGGAVEGAPFAAPPS